MTHSEENITADCEIRTLEAEELAELSLADECTLNNIVVNANQFVALLSELDSTSDIFELLTSSEEPYFRISSIGSTVSELLHITKTDSTCY